MKDVDYQKSLDEILSRQENTWKSMGWKQHGVAMLKIALMLGLFCLLIRAFYQNADPTQKDLETVAKISSNKSRNMNEMIFSPIDQYQLRWEMVSESFWINLQVTFDEYQEGAQTDIDQMAAYVLSEQVFYEDADYDQTLYLNRLGAMALRRMYFYFRLKSLKYEGFLYQFEEMVRQIESFFKLDPEGSTKLTPVVPPAL